MTPGLAAVHREQQAPAAGRSLLDLLAARCDDSWDRPAIATSEPARRRLSWGDTIAAALDLARQIESSGLQQGDRLAHLGPHGVDWILVDLACLLAGVVHLPLHHENRRKESIEQLRWLAPRATVFSGGTSGWSSRDLPGGCDLLELSPAFPPSGARRNAIRGELARRTAACDPDAPAIVFLSSGTTGIPKGVVHSQRSLAANALAATEVFLDEPNDVRLAWLPMSHALARTGDLSTAMVRGSCLNLVSDRRRVLDACRACPPTVILGVPAFYERLARAAESGRIPDLRAALGGRVRVCVSGGAALRARTADAFNRRGIPLVEGYGLAEAGPVVTLSNPRTARPGSVGQAIEGVELSLDDRPDRRGQLLVRTASRGLGLIDPEDGSRIRRFDTEWMETGDLAVIDTEGHVRITGRLVDTLQLASGIKLPPAEVERTLAEDQAFAQICVLGDGLKAPLAIIVPEPEILRAAIRRMGLRIFSRRQALRHPKLLRWLGLRIARRQRSLPPAWRLRRAILLGRPFDAARDELTPSLKLRRRTIAERFHWAVEAASSPQPPAWMAEIPSAAPQRSGAASTPPGPTPAALSPLAAALWHGGQPADGFAVAAAFAATETRELVARVIERSEETLDSLRRDGLLYEPPASTFDPPTAPLDDAPAGTAGRFSVAAEEALGEAGLWGLAVPEPHGGSGCTVQELAAAITRIAARAPTAAGLLSVHSSIGAVSALAAFGSLEQQARHLPGLARGRPLSIFAATEPDAGCDLSAIRTVIERRGERLSISGLKMFITGATHGRLVKLLALLDGRPAVVLLRLPDADGDTFRLRHYPLHPLKHAHNAALEFRGHPVDAAELLAPPADSRGESDGMRIVWHGLNRGRVTLAAQAAGTLRLLLDQARGHALRRQTWGQPIASRQLVRGRLARIAARTIACDAIAAWAATTIDFGQSGELEAIAAKVLAGECVRESAIDALGVHGGRAFLVGHPLGDSFHDHFAVTVYEGESDLLGLALFKGLARHHPSAALPRDTATSRRAAAWLAWRVAGVAGGPRQDTAILDARLRSHARSARRGLAALALRIDRSIRRHGRALAEEQLFVGSLSAEVRDMVSVLAVAHHADAAGDDALLLPADCWCRIALARAAGRRLTAADHTSLAELGSRLVLS